MKISIGSDHGGVALKEFLTARLREAGHEVTDRGTNGAESCDYPDFGARVARDVAGGECGRGIAICKSGIGMSMVANKVPGVRAALCLNVEMARLSRQHNDANVLALGAMWSEPEEAWNIVRVWLETGFEGGRHTGRVNKITRLEKGTT